MTHQAPDDNFRQCTLCDLDHKIIKTVLFLYEIFRILLTGFFPLIKGMHFPLPTLVKIPKFISAYASEVIHLHSQTMLFRMEKRPDAIK